MYSEKFDFFRYRDCRIKIIFFSQNNISDNILWHISFSLPFHVYVFFSSSTILQKQWKDTYYLLLRKLLLLEKYSNISNLQMLAKDDVMPYMWTYF